MEEKDNNIKILRLPEVISRVGLKKASIYAYMSVGNFPKPIHLGLRARGWLELEVEEWITMRLQERAERNSLH
jgi:prophage regulatory protein